MPGRPATHRVALRTAEDHWRSRAGFSSVEIAALAHIHGVARPGAEHRALLSTIVRGNPLTPIVNHGRWLVQCPASSCNAAMYASRADRRFLCGECGNVENGGDWIPVVWPMEADQIAAVLGARPGKANRNWSPHETIAALALENAARGII